MVVANRKWDDAGLEGLPFKLIIISLILALSIPIIVANWMSFDKQQTVTQLDSELDYLEAQIRQIYDGGLGLGNSKVLEMNIRDGTFTKIEYVEIGDSDLTSIKGNSIRWKLKGEGEQAHMISDGIPARSEDGSSFKFAHGLNTLYLEIKKENGVVFAEISYV